MKKLSLLLPLALLTACGEEPAPEPVETAAPEPAVELTPPDEALFTELFAASCPTAEPVATAFCRTAMGAETALCEFGLGNDDVLRHDATLEVDDGGENWVIADADALCAEHSS